MPLKTVWEVANSVDPQGDIYHLTKALTKDREATATALVTALEEAKKYDPTIRGVIVKSLDQASELGTTVGHNQALDQAISIVKQLLTPTV